MTAPGAPARARPSGTGALVGIGIGNAMEWFDWNIYATFASFFAAQFFTGADAGAELLKALAVFAVGFLARPLGGLLFGWLADRRGRKPAMVLSVGLAAAGSLVIALIPTAGSIGLAAPVILLLARLVQGLAHGGELPSAQTYLAEIAPRRSRGLWSSAIYLSGSVGVLVGTVLGAVLAALLSYQQMITIGWRIPFLIGGLFGLYALVLRSRMPETEIFEREGDAGDLAASGQSIWRQVLSQPAPMLRVVGLTVGGTVTYYVWAVAAPAFAISVRHTDPAGALWAGSVATLVFIAVLPLWGALSDRVGRRPVLLIAGLGLLALLFPLDALVRGQAWQLLVAMTAALLFVAGTVSVLPAVYAELFPTGIRAAGARGAVLAHGRALRRHRALPADLLRRSPASEGVPALRDRARHGLGAHRVDVA